jgi:hypothetical protein
MRTLQLSNEEIEIIQRALGMAEFQFSQLREQYFAQTVNVRGVTDKNETAKEADNLLEIENKFCELLINIKNGKRDV